MNSPDHPSPPELHDDPGKVELFAAQVAHDLNNLLTGILGNLELMQNRARRHGVADYDGYLESARSAGARAALFAQRLLAFSGVSADNARPLDLNAALHAAAAIVPNATLNLAGQVQILGDAGLAERAIAELIDNAVAATQAGGDIIIRTRCIGDVVELVIADTGCGMSPEIAARAIEPFFSTQPNGAGKGLGLAIVQCFARQARGSLTLETLEGAGTTATLILPVHRP